MSTTDNDTGDYRNPIAATLHGIADLFRDKPRIGRLRDDERLDGRCCLVTGANSGLGRATAILLARRGARVVLACRSGIPELADELRDESGHDVFSTVRLDLADLDAVDRCCDELRERELRIDRLILNAGVVPRSPLRTAQGYEMMFGVHFLGNARLVMRLLGDGLIANQVFADPPSAPQADPPRIIFVSSETHRSGTPIELEQLGDFVEYGAMGSIAQYGHSKLVMTAWLQELGRRLAPAGEPQVAVHCLCPGPINSNIARDAPALFRPLLSLIMGAFFASPEKAAEPVLYLSCAREIAGQTGIYLHLMTPKPPAAQARDPQIAAAVWDATPRLLGR